MFPPLELSELLFQHRVTQTQILNRPLTLKKKKRKNKRKQKLTKKITSHSCMV
jgi:hypothetical protein